MANLQLEEGIRVARLTLFKLASQQRFCGFFRRRPALEGGGLYPPRPGGSSAQDPLDQCRLCQELVHAGSFFTPSVVTLAASLSFTAAIFASARLFPDHSATAFAWQSRAPPRH